MGMEPGYDGFPPVFLEVRDIDGKGKRQSVSQQNINVDRLEWLLAHKRIEQYQHTAGRALQKDWQTAQRINYMMAVPMTGSPGTASAPSDARLEALERYSKAIDSVAGARHCLGIRGEQLVWLVVIEGKSLSQAGAILKWNEKGVLAALLVALDALARHYHLA